MDLSGMFTRATEKQRKTATWKMDECRSERSVREEGLRCFISKACNTPRAGHGHVHRERRHRGQRKAPRPGEEAVTRFVSQLGGRAAHVTRNRASHMPE